MTSLEEPTLGGAYGRKDEGKKPDAYGEITINTFQKKKIYLGENQ